MIKKQDVTAGFVSLITTATTKPCGRGSVPISGGKGIAPPYYVAHAIDFLTEGAPLADENEGAEATYQLTCVGTGSEQVELLADEARTAVLGRNPATSEWLHPLTVPGASCMSRSLDTEPGESSDPADGIISSVIRFRLCLTPA